MFSSCHAQPDLCAHTQIAIPASFATQASREQGPDRAVFLRQANEVLTEIWSAIQASFHIPEIQEVEFFERVAELCDYLSEKDRQTVLCCMGADFAKAYETPGALGVLWLNAREVADSLIYREIYREKV